MVHIMALLNIMFHAPMGRFQLEFIVLPLFSTVVPSNICMFLYCRPFAVITTFSTDLVGVEETEVTSTPTRPVENVVITAKDLQDTNIHILDWTTMENKDKIINSHYDVNFKPLFTKGYI